jgi:beta-galactosidase
MAASDRRIRLGSAYYPEQSPRERWALDARLMADVGLSLVRLGEFAWAELEPEAGRFELAWLEDAIDVFAGQGLEIVLGTPTAAPPMWLVREHPDVLPLSADRHRIGFGTRRHYCPNTPALQAATDRIVSALGDHFGRDTRVGAWQIDNELGGRCYCDHCRVAFQRWLEHKYETVDALNQSWGTAFWSQRYDAWTDVGLPAPDAIRDGGFTLRAPNPGLALDFRRFASDSYVRYLRRQTELLRSRIRPEQQITHNLMGFKYAEIDYAALGAEVDFVSWDNYPSLDLTHSWTLPSLSADAMRGLKRAPVWVMEQQVGPMGWEYVRTPRRGQMRLYAYQAIGHGAEALVFFRWQTARFGTEQHWFGVLDADGDGSVGRRYHELGRLSAELQRLDVLEDAQPDADVAVLYDYDSRFALQIQPANAALRHEASVHRWYAVLRRLGLGVDVVPAGSDLSRYRVVVVPSMPVVDEDVAADLEAYVEAGGTLVVGPRAGVRDPSGAVPTGRPPARLDRVLGIEVTDIASGEESAELHGLVSGAFTGWFEELRTLDATPLAKYVDGDFAGGTAISDRRAGFGTAVYVGGVGDDAVLDSLFRTLCGRLELTLFELPNDVELIPLRSREERLFFVLNHSDREQRIGLSDGDWRDLIGGGVGDRFVVPKFDVVLLRLDATAGQRRVDGQRVADAAPLKSDRVEVEGGTRRKHADVVALDETREQPLERRG